jgi:hypothetical protein
MIASETNESVNLAGNKSLAFAIQLTSTNDSLSPIVDTSRTSLIAISNKVNKPTEGNSNVAAFDNVTAFTHATGAFAFTTAGKITSTVANVRTAMAGIGIGKYITISSTTTTGNSGTFLVTAFDDNGTTATLSLNTTFTAENSVSGTTITAKILFADESAPVGSSTISKYVTTPVKFANASTYTRVMLAANIPAEADVSVYYKTCTGDSNQLNNTKYTLMTPDSSIVKVANGDPAFSDIAYTLTEMPSFDTIQLKIVMNSSNTSAVPIIRDFRVIACP